MNAAVRAKRSIMPLGRILLPSEDTFVCFVISSKVNFSDTDASVVLSQTVANWRNTSKLLYHQTSRRLT
ncbi:MAG: hypothetical protein ACTS6G_00410 [Candidatus Hodgkinia cicadicola]